VVQDREQVLLGRPGGNEGELPVAARSPLALQSRDLRLGGRDHQGNATDARQYFRLRLDVRAVKSEALNRLWAPIAAAGSAVVST